MKKKQIFILLLSVLSTVLLEGQDLRQIPHFAPDNAKRTSSAIAQSHQSIESTFAVPAHFNKEAKAAYLSQRGQIEQDLIQLIEQEAIFDDVLSPFVQQVYTKIKTANTGIPACNVILSNNPTPNAFSIGDGTLVIHTGLLYELENEDQVAFVLCHEMAHFALQHATKRIVRNIEKFHSAEFKKQLEQLQKTEFNQSELLENMVRNIRFQSTYHHRDLERQADSLAYHFLLRTEYDPNQVQRLMELFETIDQPRDSALAWDQFLGCATYPFQSKWLDQGGTSIWGAAIAAQESARKALADSLRTHPDSRNRLLWIEAMAAQLHPAGHVPTTHYYASIRFLSALENVNACFQRKQYDRTIYLAMLYQRQYPNCLYFREVISLSLHGLYQHSKSHTLSDVLSQSSPYYDKKYNELLILLNNLQIKDFIKLQSCFVESQNAPEGEYALLAAYCLAVDKAESPQINALKKAYLAQFPKGRFAQNLKSEKK